MYSKYNLISKYFNIYIIYNMPAKINMFISNGNPSLKQATPPPLVKATPSAINAPMLARVHNVRPGCGSCGRH
jgi:hypothetical protein